MLECIDADGTRTGVTRAEIGLEPDQNVGALFAAPDGVLWAIVGHPGEVVGSFDGVVAYDGSTWSLIPYDGDDLAIYAAPLAVDADGVVWVYGSLADHYAILSWDGESWTSPPAGQFPDQPIIRPWPNGIVWFVS